MSNGAVVSIHIAATASAPMVSVNEVRAVAGTGLEGDRYCTEAGTYSDQPGWGRDVTLVEIETIEALKHDYEIELDAKDGRRNIATHGVALNHLVGRDFKVGEVLLRGSRLCDPCSHLERLTAKGVMRGLTHRGGLRAEILTDGRIRVGDKIDAADREESC